MRGKEKKERKIINSAGTSGNIATNGVKSQQNRAEKKKHGEFKAII